MKRFSLSLISLFTGFSLLISCSDKTKDGPEPIDSIIYTYRLNYDTVYSMSNTGEWSEGSARVIDSSIYLHYGTHDSIFINGDGFAYNADMAMYFNLSRTTVSFSGTDKAFINITYVTGVGHRSYHSYKGYRQ